MPTRSVSWEDDVYVELINRLEESDDKNFSEIVNDAVKNGLPIEE